MTDNVTPLRPELLLDGGKVQLVYLGIARAISDGRGAIAATDMETAAAFGIALAELGGTDAGIDEIAAFAKKHQKRNPRR